MNIRVKKTSIVFTGIANESQLEDIKTITDKSGCKYEPKDYCCTAVITGNLNKFISLWNKQFK